MSKEFFIVIEKSTVYHEGDERSRTHPGHGYPAYSEEVDRIRRFTDEASLVMHVKRNINDLQKMEILRCSKVEISTTVQLHLN